MLPNFFGGQTSGKGEEPIAIVRYPNRRFYDRSKSRYVTLQEIADMVRAGKVIEVRDSKTDRDLTGRVLTQILLEYHPERAEVLPVPVLHLLLGANDIVLGFLGEYLRQSINYLEFWQKAASLGPLSTPLDWMQRFMPAAARPSSHAPSKETETPMQADATSADEQERHTLARRVAELERKLRDLQNSTDEN